ncbi:hypothetical protein SNEBB_010059 [Seison nebaliae]|nr:hypothetical protein SNEBB_010059 [Seison nebaliae]
MGGRISKTEFDWTYTEEPHATRRRLILHKYPKIKKLMGHDKRIVFPILLTVTIQVLITYLISLHDYSWTTIILMSWIVGGTFNNSLQLAMHEVSHNLAFGNKYLWANRILGYVANMPLGIPASSTFKKYHLDHHRYMGDDELDVDIPSAFECFFFQFKWTKCIWVLFQPFFYGLRPLIVLPRVMNIYEMVNIVTQLSFDFTILYFFGVKSLIYLVMGSLIGMGYHPLAGHFISEHYVFNEGFETYSYYGSGNLLTYNVGYHNEHHDFPSIPGWKLGQVREIAPEYYENLPSYTSWTMVIWNFIMNSNIGPYSRIKRNPNKKSDRKTTNKLNKDTMWKMVSEEALNLFPNDYFRDENGDIHRRRMKSS